MHVTPLSFHRIRRAIPSPRADAHFPPEPSLMFDTSASALWGQERVAFCEI